MFRRTQGAADGLDPELIAVFVEERDHLVVGQLSSAAKKAEVASGISFSWRASAISRLIRRISSAGFAPADPGATAWPWRLHHMCGGYLPTPTCGMMTRVECERGPPWMAWCSRTILIAFSRSSDLNLLGMFRFSFGWIGAKPRALQVVVWL